MNAIASDVAGAAWTAPVDLWAKVPPVAPLPLGLVPATPAACSVAASALSPLFRISQFQNIAAFLVSAYT